MGVALIKGKDETKFIIADDLTNVSKEEHMKVSVWITDFNQMTGSHTIHIMINDKELIAYTCEDGSVLIGKYMSVYSEWKKPVVFRTITEIETLTDLYLKKFGDPTAEDKTIEIQKQQKEESVAKESSNNMIYVIGGLIALLGLAGVVTLVVSGKRRKKENVDESIS